MKRLVGKKAAAIVVIAGLVIGVSGVAFADFMDGGPGSGSATTGFPTTFAVSSPIFTGGPLYPGQGGDSIVATIQNATGTSLPLQTITVAIGGVTMNPPGSLYAQQPGVPPCTTDDYRLQAPAVGPWTGGLTNGLFQQGMQLTWNGTGAPIPSGDYVVGGAASPAIGNAFQGPLSGLTLLMLNLPQNQNACQGASVQVTVGVNSPSSSGGGPTNAASFVVTKSATPSGVYAGSSTPITYTLTARNTGGVSGSVSIGDTVPPGTTFVSGSNSCPAVTSPTTCSTSVTGSIVNWMIANVASGGSVAVMFEVTANSGDSTGAISNTAAWSGPGCTAPVTCPTNTTTTNVTVPTPLLITASPTTTTYGGATPTVTPEYTPSIGSELTTPPTCASTVTAATSVGTYSGANTCSGASDPAYIITYAPGTAVVDPAPLTVTASSGSFTQGGTPPTITVQYSGFQNGDSVSSLTTPPTCSTTATNTSMPGTYPTTCAGAADPNYTITYVQGSVTVTPAPAATTPAATTPAATTPAPVTSPTTSGSTSPAIAFTGALLSEEWLIGIAAVLLGSGLMVIARWRRRMHTYAAK
jgi:uncharacterized repeat protein (TIGR01451 family)